MQVVVDELLTHYELTGKGKLVLLLHGWADNVAGLKALQTGLVGRYQVLAVDLPGFGQTHAPRESWDLDDYARFLNHLLAKLELDGLYAVVGHSNGGALAIRALALGQLQAEKLVLVAASGVRNRQSVRRLLLKLIAKVGKIATFWLPERYRRAIRKKLYASAGSDALVAESLKDTFAKVVRQDVTADAAKLSLPTLLIYAENDTAVPLAYGELYNRLIKGSQLITIPGAGHFVHLEEPALVGAAIKDFLA